MARMIVKMVIEVEVDEYDKKQAIEKACCVVETIPRIFNFDVKQVTFKNGHPVDDDYSDSPDYPGNSRGGIWMDE